MRALLLESKDGPAACRVRDVPSPTGAHPWADGESLLVDVRAAAVGFPDLLQTRGAYQHGAEAPYVVGGEFAGVVRETAAGSRFEVGDRVAGLSVWGALAEVVTAIPRYTVRLPDELSWTQGAAFYVNYLTALFTLERARFTDGDSVLVHGAAGGVGTAVLDLLRGRARPSIAVVSTPEKSDVARSCGADEVVVATEDWLAEVRAMVPHGVDVVVDPVGGDRFTDSLRALDVGGRLMAVGFASGDIPQVQVNRLLLRDLTVTGVAVDPWHRRFPDDGHRMNAELEQLAATGRVRPHVGDVLTFDRAAEALELLEARRALGKVVVEL
ncbi:NADPH:quinone oxidoreductase family protein [Nocardioides halotolerans]|uniref:NADPH:quinone oxidoreductase family protein n=1 Tax=Nocardioides halotolerans TaxID=433660 RepID=UPI0003FE636E|nr:NADPH:quinone oxidoreductase family protein [Nocardioides halotolerans]